MEFARVRIRMCRRSSVRRLLPFRQIVLKGLKFTLRKSALIPGGVNGGQEKMFWRPFRLVQQARYASLAISFGKFDREKFRVQLQEFRESFARPLPPRQEPPTLVPWPIEAFARPSQARSYRESSSSSWRNSVSASSDFSDVQIGFAEQRMQTGLPRFNGECLVVFLRSMFPAVAFE